MSLAFTNVKSFMPEKGGIRKSVWDITTDASYPTGGYVISAANFNLNGILAIVPIGIGASAIVSALPSYNCPTLGSTALGKLQFFVSAAAAAEFGEAAASLATLNGQKYRVLVIGW